MAVHHVAAAIGLKRLIISLLKIERQRERVLGRDGRVDPGIQALRITGIRREEPVILIDPRHILIGHGKVR